MLLLYGIKILYVDKGRIRIRIHPYFRIENIRSVLCHSEYCNKVNVYSLLKNYTFHRHLCPSYNYLQQHPTMILFYKKVPRRLFNATMSPDNTIEVCDNVR